MANELAGKVAIVTGGASGIGRGTVELFAREGAHVVLADVDKTGEQVAASIGKSVAFKQTDVSRAEEIQDLVDFAISEFGGLDIMFNNAAILGRSGRFLEDEFNSFDRIMAVNTLGVMLGAQRAARHMAAHGGGSIINTASTAAILANFGMICYRASKAAIVQLSKTMAIELAEFNIRVNCIIPGHIRPTGLSAPFEVGLAPDVIDRLNSALKEVTMSYQPFKRQGRPEDVAQAALFLASDRSAQITGAVLPVDGGVTAGDPVNHHDQIKAARASVLAD